MAISLGVTNFTSAQCKGFTKKKCMPNLAPFISNGQLNSTQLLNGESAELSLTFYSDQDYRILTCTDGRVGEVEFKLLDMDRKQLFDTKKHSGTGQYWDFRLKATQQMILEVSVPVNKNESKSAAVAFGCIAVVVGFKPKE